jgi:hypothetical protein
MADSAFVGMEEEIESFDSQRTKAAGTRANKVAEEERQELLAEDPADIESTSPLLGPPVLINQNTKKWYNTPSVSSYKMPRANTAGVLAVTSVPADFLERWCDNGPSGKLLYIIGL